jgi:TRAP-type mannitol/chloroaromatic compound transport system permease small subunit
LFYEKFSERTKAMIDLIGTVVFLMPTCLIIIWAGWNFTIAAYQLGAQPDSVSEFFTMLVSSGIGERSQDPGGLLNRWVIKGVIPLSFVCLLLASIAFFLEKVRVLQTLHDGDSK